MEYETFKWQLLEEVKQRAGMDMTVRLHRIARNNQVAYDGLSIYEGESGVSPVFPVEMYYESFREGTAIDSLADEILVQRRGCISGLFLQQEDYTRYECIRDRLYFKVVNYALNEEMLQDMPHIRHLDLAVIFYVEVILPDGEKGGFMVKNQELAIWGVTQKELEETAFINACRLKPLLIMNIAEAVPIDMPEELEAPPMLIVTNEDKLFGAGTILYPGTLKRIAEKFNSGFLLIPSSVHEVIAIPDDGCQDVAYIREMISTVNATKVEDHELLSGNVYRYDRKADRLSIA